jgi:4-hydroxybenzoate polyprenyltransferase
MAKAPPAGAAAAELPRHSRLKPYLALCRVSNLPTVWTNVLAASLLSGASVTPRSFLLLAFSLSCFYLAGMVLNDLFDCEFDRAFRPTRPIPRGDVSEREALMLTVALSFAGLGALAFAPDLRGGLAALGLLAVIIAYDYHHKENPFSVLLMAGCRFLVFAVAGFALAGKTAGPLLVAGGAQFLYIVALSLFARYDNNRKTPLPFPSMPLLLAGISLLDGILLALLVAPAWLAAGAGGFFMTLAGQRFVRGD